MSFPVEKLRTFNSTSAVYDITRGKTKESWYVQMIELPSIGILSDGKIGFVKEDAGYVTVFRNNQMYEARLWKNAKITFSELRSKLESGMIDRETIDKVNLTKVHEGC